MAAVRHDRIDAPCVIDGPINGESERTAEATWMRIGALSGCFAPQECANSMANAGHAST
jgi:hypothetical protein